MQHIWPADRDRRPVHFRAVTWHFAKTTKRSAEHGSFDSSRGGSGGGNYQDSRRVNPSSASFMLRHQFQSRREEQIVNIVISEKVSSNYTPRWARSVSFAARMPRWGNFSFLWFNSPACWLSGARCRPWSRLCPPLVPFRAPWFRPQRLSGLGTRGAELTDVLLLLRYMYTPHRFDGNTFHFISACRYLHFSTFHLFVFTIYFQFALSLLQLSSFYFQLLS